MTEAELRVQIERLCASDYDPVLAPADIDALVAIAKRPDEWGLDPDDPEWVPTYDLNAAVASGWETKAARAAELFRFEEDNQGFYREQVFNHCRAMADRYNRGMVPVEVVSWGTTP